MKVAVFLLAASIGLTPQAPLHAEQPAAQVTIRVIMTNDPGFDPEQLTYTTSAAHAEAVRLHAAVVANLSEPPETPAALPDAATATPPPSPDTAASGSETAALPLLPAAKPKTLVPE